MDYIDSIYYTLMDDLVEEVAVFWVEKLREDPDCRRAWEAVYGAKERLCSRLNTEEDPDVEELLSALEYLQWQSARRMFLYGMRFRNE